MDYETELWFHLESLTISTTAFYSRDYELNGQLFRVFSYRLASWTEFQLPGALDARGVMYDITDASKPKLVCLPQQKFFNYSEGNVDHNQAKVVLIMDKRDGSLISSYIDRQGQLRLKSKTSISSQQAIDATNWLNKEPMLKHQIMQAELAGYTVNMEWTGPDNRIVVGYATSELRVLNIRNRSNGETLTPNHPKLQPFSKWLVDYWTPNHDTPVSNLESEALALQQGEGYVVELVNPQQQQYFIKCKSEKYVLLHRNKDSLNNVRSLYELTINEGTDDMRDMFSTDPVALMMIDRMERYVYPIYNSICNTVDEFWETNRCLDRKSYAILASEQYPDIMQLLMNKFIGREVDVKGFMIKKFDKYRPDGFEDKVEE